MTEELKTEILALGRDALLYIDRIKKINRQITKVLENNIIRDIRKNIEILEKAKDSIIKETIYLEENKEEAIDTYKRILAESNKIKESYESMFKNSYSAHNQLNSAIHNADMELEDLKKVSTELAALESKVRTIRGNLTKQDIKAVEGAEKLGRLLRRDIRRIVKEERMENKLIEKLEDTLESMNKMIQYLENMIIPSLDSAKSLSTELNPLRYKQLSRELMNRNLKFISDFFRAFAKKAETTCCSDSMTSAIERCKDEDKNIQKNIRFLEEVIKKFSDRYFKQLTALKLRITSLENMDILEKVA